MIIESLKVNNYRVFAGEHTFDLSPRIKYGVKRPIILFGGLNGAGKTSILSAIQLALYGRQSLGIGITQKQYDEHLVKLIHRNKHSKHEANNASTTLRFTYAKLGEKFEYQVTREWMKIGKKVKEVISISENGNELEALDYDQCQGFLNELIPIGLSNLFFFDGEKIAELAEDTKGEALGDAIKRLIGLDQFDILANDLSVLIRNKQPDLFSKESAQKVKLLERELTEINNNTERALEEFESATICWTAVSQDLDRAESEFRAKGGAWINSYEKENQLKNELAGEKKNQESTIRDFLAGDFPLGLAPQFTNKVIKQLNKEKTIKNEKVINEYFIENSEIIKNALVAGMLSEKDADKALSIMNDTTNSESENKLIDAIHDVSEPTHYRVLNSIENAKSSFKKTTTLLNDLGKLNDRIDQIGINLSRAPSQESIQTEFDRLSLLKDEKAKYQAKRATFAERYKKLLQDKLRTLRNLDKLTESAFSTQTSDRSIELANKSRGLLRDFGSKMAESKVNDLETEFAASFERLARKEEINLKAKINPKTFAVEIIRDDNHIVDKNELSAGEKQIYAISILEALARTSGRKLPIIIDTPLGRLDSKHRNNLIKNYFPNASHQVIILSTDTEVDEAFYSDLSKHISHAYRLDYDSKSASSQAIEGYFWRNKELFKEAI